MTDHQTATEGAHWRIHSDWIELAVDDDSKGAISGFAATPAYPAYWLIEGEDGMGIGRADTLAEACAKVAEAAGVVLPSPLVLIDGLTDEPPAQLRAIGERVLDAVAEASPEGDIKAGLGAVFGFFEQAKINAFCEAVGRAAVAAVREGGNG